MKSSILGITTLFIMLFSITGLAADKIIIKGQPILIEQQADVYVPATPFTSTDYYYVTMGDTSRVCYQTVQPALADVDAGIFSFKLGTDVVKVHCYNYSTDYFTVD